MHQKRHICNFRKYRPISFKYAIQLHNWKRCTHSQNPCPGNNSSLPCWIWIIFHTIVVHDPRVCHDLDPRSYLQGQGQSAHIAKYLCPGHNSSLPCWIWIIFHTIVVHDSRMGLDWMIQSLVLMIIKTRGWIIQSRMGHALTQGHNSKVKVTVHLYPKLLSGP